jgi:cytochrome P450
MTQAATTLESRVSALFEGAAEAIADPYAIYARLRVEAPVFMHGGIALISRFDDVEAVIRDPARFSSSHEGATRVAAALDRLSPRQAELYRQMNQFDSLFLTRLDDPHHWRMRSVVHKAFTPRVIGHMREQVQAMTDQLLAPIAGAGEVDFVDAFAYQLPLKVIDALLGVPDEDVDRIREWTSAIAAYRGSLDHLEEAHSAVQAWQEFARELIARNRKKPATPMMQAIVAAEAAGGLTPDEVVAMFVILLIGGHETTTNLIGTGLMELHRQQQWRLLTAKPYLAPAAVEELLRYEAPVQSIARTAAAETEVAGVRLAPGQSVMVLLASADRDETVFDEPDRVDLGRRIDRHLGFGLGPHFCLGASLARLEGDVVFTSLATRHPDMHVDTHPVWRDNPHLRGLRRLPVDLRA